MQIRRIGCKYFLNFGEWNEIYFKDENNIISIIGQWHDEPSRSNRSGKSSFVEIILYAFYGKTRAKREIDLINKNFPNEDMIVEVELDNGIIITRGRTSKNEIILNLTGFEGADKRVVQEEIDKIIGLTYEDFVMTSFFVQGDIHSFMNAGPTGQKQLISKWLEKEYWKKFEIRAKKEISDIELEIAKLEVIANDLPDASIDKEINDQINILNNNKSELDKVLEGLAEAFKDIENDLKAITEKEKIEKELKNINTDIKNLQNEIEEFEEEIEDIKKEIKQAKVNKKRINELKNSDEKLENIKEEIKQNKLLYKEKNGEILTVKSEYKSIERQYNKIKNFDSVCPVTHNPCTSAESIESTKNEYIKNARVLKNKLNKLEKELKIIDNESDNLDDKKSEFEKLYLELQDLKNKPTEDELNKQKLSIENKVKNKNDIILTKKVLKDEKSVELEKLNEIDFNALKSKKSEINLQISDNKKQLNDIINNIADLKANLNQAKEKRKKAKQALKDIEVLEKDKNLYKIVSFMFSKNGIPSNQIETAFNEIESETNIILEYIQSGISMEFSPDRELKTWEDNCLVCNYSYPTGFRKAECPECGEKRRKKRKEELNIKIFSNGNEMDFNLESGGGKVLISLAIRLAFTRLLRRRLGVNLNIIIFDEVFGMLDSVNREQMIKLITTMLINEFDFKQILVISHEESVRDALPNIIKVTKYDNYSEFAWN